MQEFKKGALFEASFLRPVSAQPPLQKPVASPPPPLPRPPIVKLKPLMPAPAEKEEVKPQAPEIRKAKAPEAKENNGMLTFLKEHLPHLQLLDPPHDFIDFCFLCAEEEEPLVQKIIEALSKAKIRSVHRRVNQLTDADLSNSYKAFVATKKRIQDSSHLHSLAGRRADGQPHLGGTLLLLMPEPEALESPEIKRAFWNHLLQAAAS